MTLIKSISGIRGTIGGKPDQSLTPIEIMKYTAAFATIVSKEISQPLIIVGRDGRISGPMVRDIVVGTLQSLGIQVMDLGISTTPTVEMAVIVEKACGGIILTASHNPEEWNALKLLNASGEFISAEIGKEVLALGNAMQFDFVKVNQYKPVIYQDYMNKHIEMILKHPLVNVEAIKEKKYKVVVDGINSSGALYVPALLNALGVSDVAVLNSEVNGKFAHNPEPLPEHLLEISNKVIKNNADLGIVVDPDVDRLCFICEDGSMFGEEYTLVSIADYVLLHTPGNTVSNLSSTKALKDITLQRGGQYYASAVGEVNVVSKMKEVKAVIGGEGNGGVIIPEMHYGRDALIGVALFLSHLATTGKSVKSLRGTYPDYFISKNKIELEDSALIAKIFEGIKEIYKKYPINTVDGLKIEFENEWVHLRTSNTEPIIRIYAESTSETTANNIASKLINDIKELMK